MKGNIQVPKGTRDFTSKVMFRRNYIFKKVRSCFERYGYAPIETPAMENIETLSGKYGQEGDRLIFKVLNSGDFLSKSKIDSTTTSKSLSKDISNKALRYDLTVPFARFVVNNQNQITFPFKRYQMQNVWRADRPQKGRFREFYQCDADVIGSKSLLNEIELIQLCDDIFTSLNIPNIQILINNRKILAAMIELMSASEYFDQFVIILDKIDKIGVENVKKELIKLGIDIKKINLLDKFLNIKNINDISVLVNQNELGKKGIQELDFILKSIDSLELKSSELKFNISLARGLDYYTGSIFEVKSSDVNIGSVAGGGRYDDLTSIFGLKDVSGVGISFGIDRIYLVMEELGLFPKDIDISSKVLFLNFGELEAKYCFKYLEELRNNNISSELYPNNDKIKKQMNYANNKGVQFVVMIGEDEMKSGQLSVKNMSTGDQKEMSISELIKIIL
ncbi:MAG: histidine--tRNA ligase [Flavobacteriales bacterium]|nr:histidine--tRNA ligase [Flavobacteriales bacterium]OUW98141.1 MAG: histidine--tRNA ligase [Flavobacteriales bacterium TMED228]